MTTRAIQLALIAAAACVWGALAGCGADGVTPDCPPLPLYQTFPLGDAAPPDAGSADSATSQAEFSAAVKAGCATAPSTAVLPDPSAASGGGDGDPSVSHAGQAGSH